MPDSRATASAPGQAPVGGLVSRSAEDAITMECRVCNYTLWNSRGRACPECGTPFKPSDYGFRPNRVEFMCPDCGQAYYGTSPQGHLEPSEFNCVRCGRYVTMDNDLILRPVGGAEADVMAGEPVPWLRRHHVGWFTGWWKTVLLGFTRPVEIAAGVRPGDPVGLGFYLATTLATTLAGALVGLLCFGAMLPAFLRGGMPMGWPMLGFLPLMLLVVAVGLLIQVVIVWVWGALTHLLLGIGDPVPHPMRRTHQAFFYTSGPTVLRIIGSCGDLIALVWWVASASRCLSDMQRVSMVRAVLCVIGPLVAVMGIAFLAGIVVMVASAAAAGGNFGGGPRPMPMGAGGPQGVAVIEASRISDVKRLRLAILDYAQFNDGHGPSHPAKLFGSRPAVDLVHADRGGQYAINGVPYSAAAGSLGAAGLQAALEDVVTRNDAPDQGIHRMGDIVFLHRGIPVLDETTDPALWLLISIPPDISAKFPGGLPTAATWALQGATFHVARVQSEPLSIDGADFEASLARQNELRQRHGLPPVPDPLLVPVSK